MQVLWFLLQIIYVVLSKKIDTEHVEDKGLISGGEIYNPLDYPYVVGIQIRKSRFLRAVCTGSLISSLFVLTAAHCTFRRTAYDIKVLRSNHIFKNNPNIKWLGLSWFYDTT